MIFQCDIFDGGFRHPMAPRIWTIPSPLNVKFLMRIFNGRLILVPILGTILTSRCSCGEDEESFDHLVIGYPFSRETWKLVNHKLVILWDHPRTSIGFRLIWNRNWKKGSKIIRFGDLAHSGLSEHVGQDVLFEGKETKILIL